jgi:hypothetical protein
MLAGVPHQDDPDIRRPSAMSQRGFGAHRSLANFHLTRPAPTDQMRMRCVKLLDAQHAHLELAYGFGSANQPDR